MINKIIPYLAFFLVRLLSFTYRFEFRNNTVKEDILSNSRNYVHAVWHNNILACILSQIGESHVAIVSSSRDGELIAKIMTFLGNKVARGSSSKGGRQAMKEMIHIMNTENLPGAISVDGPRGPVYKAKKGIVEVAKGTNAYVVPFSSYPKSYWCFEKSWDKFRLPKPFSKIIFYYGEPIEVNPNLPVEDYPKVILEIETALHLGEEKIKQSLDL